MVFGTPEFMSPEQACGQSLDPRSDLYSLAATMFAMVTGCGMYEAKSPIEWLTAHARTPPPHLADGLPALARFTALDQALQRCLAKRREDRPASADEMIALLASIEPTLADGAPVAIDLDATSTARGAHLRVSPSSYIEALDPDATLVPSRAPRASDPTLPPPSQMNPSFTPVPEKRPGNAMLIPPPSRASSLHVEAGIAAPVPPRRRGAVLVIGAAVIAGMIVTAIVVASAKREAKGPAVAKEIEHHAVAADAAVAVAVVVPDAAPADAAVAQHPSESDASPAAGSSAPVRPAPPRTRTKAEIARLLAEAESAQKAGNRLRQITRADAVLRLDPRNARAKLLLADGLIASGDHDRGCKYLHELGRNTAARARARQAGCSTN
jgi:serine/threonine-protein kinase